MGFRPRRPERRVFANFTTAAWPFNFSGAAVQRRRSNLIATTAQADLDHMAASSWSRSPLRHLIGAAAICAIWWIAFEDGDRIPVLAYVNLGIHELGHMLTHGMSALATAMMGSIFQLAVPAALALYFLLWRGDWLAAGLCLAWAGSSAVEVAIYVADAPVRELELIGGEHDWAFILGPEGYDAIEQAGPLAEQIRDGGQIALVAGLALCLAAPFRRAGSAARLTGGHERGDSSLEPLGRLRDVR